MFISKIRLSLKNLARDKRGFLPIILLLLAGLTMMVIALVGVLGVSAKRQVSYGLASQAYYCYQAGYESIQGQASTTALFTNCNPGDCYSWGTTSTCAVCSNVASVLSCNDPAITSDYTIKPPVTCSSRAQIGYAPGTSNKNVTIIGDCGTATYSQTHSITGAVGGADGRDGEGPM